MQQDSRAENGRTLAGLCGLPYKHEILPRCNSCIIIKI